ncbi:MAG: cytochrome c family protein [Alphaproteobacteria bacterium]|nr:cytochrome c family protein [Alphaproteobacteria bacterium]
MKPNSFELNKIIGALLLAAIVAMVAGFAAMGMYTGSIGEHGHHEEKRGYTIAGAESAGENESAAAAAPETPVDIMPLMASADVAAGQAQIKKCTACHTFDQGGKNGVGPNQWGLFGAACGHRADYSYSDAIKALHSKGMKWDEQTLSEFLANPKKFAPGNKMSFAGIKNPQDRANLIAYLKTLR